MVVNESLAESYLATVDVVPRVRHAVADCAKAAGIVGEQLDALRLAVSEAVTNVIVHAYREKPGMVHVTVRPVDEDLWILIADDGCGCNTPPENPGLGWGLALITNACAEFALVERAGGGTDARMRFLIAAEPC